MIGAFEARERVLGKVNALLNSGAFREAGEIMASYLPSDPEFSEGRFKLASALGRQDRFEEAATELRWLIERNPNRKSVLFALGKAEKELGHVEDAVMLFERAVSVDPQDVVSLAELGTCYLAANRTPEAIETFLNASRLAPGIARLQFLLGSALASFDMLEESIPPLKEASRVEPQNEEYSIRLVKQLLATGENVLANATAQAAVSFHPTSFPLLCQLATSETRLCNSANAEAAYKRAVTIDSRALNAYADWLQEEGRFDAAADLLSELIELEPKRGHAYYQLAHSKRYELKGRPLLEAVEETQSEEDLTREDRMYMAYASGLLKERSLDFERAMASYDEANALAYSIYNAPRPLDRVVETRQTERMIARFGSQFPWARSSSSRSVRPILIVGMIRSGTTLLDQTVSSHPLVSSAGELNFWAKTGGSLGPHIEVPTDEGVEVIAQRYLARLGSAGQTPWVTDKMPLNYRYLGLARLAFPDIKVIHIKRNPLDTCLSIYTNHFGPSTRWAYNQSNIVFAYRDYLRFMEHWRAVLPAENLFEMSYEELVEDKEPLLRRILEFCEIPWDDACLRHDANDASIRTPSRWQARQPIYKSSTGRWKRFEPYLGDLLELKPVIDPA